MRPPAEQELSMCLFWLTMLDNGSAYELLHDAMRAVSMNVTNLGL